MTRAEEIARCEAEIAECVRNQRLYPAEKVGALQGELDWREELHWLVQEKSGQ